MHVNSGCNLCHLSVQAIAIYITLVSVMLLWVFFLNIMEMPLTKEENNSLCPTLVFE